MRTSRLLGAGAVALALGLAANAVLGPLVLETIRYRTSETTLNQVIGGDAATLAIVVPVALAAAVLLWRGHRAGAVVVLGPAIFAAYTMPQLIVGEEYLEIPGNNERFFLLQLAVFVLGGLLVVGSWRAAGGVAAVPRRTARVTGWVLLAVAAFLAFGMHLPTLFDAWSDTPQRTEYLSTPTPFWLVKLMDLGIVVPVAVATGIGLLRGRPWAARLAFAMVGAYALLTTAVLGMAIAMQVTNDPDAQVANVVAFAVFAGAFLTLAAALYRPVFRRGAEPEPVADREARAA